MRKNRLFILAGIFAFFVIGIVLFLSVSDKPAPSNVTVSFTPPVDTPTPKNIQHPDKKKTSASGSVIDASSEINDPSPALSGSPQQKRFTLNILDAMGDPIPGGIILAGSKEYKFTKGELIVTNLATAEIPISVSAEGYSPLTTTIKPEPGETQTIVMDYVSSFELYVYSNRHSIPAQDASIRIWKMNAPARPPLPEYQVPSSVDGDRINTVNFHREQWEYRINQIGNESSYERYPVFDWSGKTFPRAEDSIIALGKCSWFNNVSPEHEFNEGGEVGTFSGLGWINNIYFPRADYKSNKLRISDTLSFLSNKDKLPLSAVMEKCEILRNGKQGWFYIKFPELPVDSPVWKELKTDNEGKCLIPDLPPALYYVQAVKDNQSSQIIPLHPCCAGAEIQLATASRVLVIVKRSGMENKQSDFSELVASEFSLKGIENTSGFYTANTKSGGTILDVAHGNYLLQVKPSEGQPVEKRVTVQHPKEKLKY